MDKLKKDLEEIIKDAFAMINVDKSLIIDIEENSEYDSPTFDVLVNIDHTGHEPESSDRYGNELTCSFVDGPGGYDEEWYYMRGEDLVPMYSKIGSLKRCEILSTLFTNVMYESIKKQEYIFSLQKRDKVNDQRIAELEKELEEAKQKAIEWVPVDRNNLPTGKVLAAGYDCMVSGALYQDGSDEEPSVTCNKHGYVPHHNITHYVMVALPESKERQLESCSSCGGNGTVGMSSIACDNCEGLGVVEYKEPQA